MIEFALIFLTICIVVCFGLFLSLKSHEAFSRVLYLSLISSLIVCAIVLWAIHSGESMYIDVALTLALLSFMDVQFYAVYLRRKGDI